MSGSVIEHKRVRVEYVRIVATGVKIVEVVIFKIDSRNIFVEIPEVETFNCVIAEKAMSIACPVLAIYVLAWTARPCWPWFSQLDIVIHAYEKETYEYHLQNGKSKDRGPAHFDSRNQE